MTRCNRRHPQGFRPAPPPPVYKEYHYHSYDEHHKDVENLIKEAEAERGTNLMAPYRDILEHLTEDPYSSYWHEQLAGLLRSLDWWDEESDDEYDYGDDPERIPVPRAREGFEWMRDIIRDEARLDIALTSSGYPWEVLDEDDYVVDVGPEHAATVQRALRSKTARETRKKKARTAAALQLALEGRKEGAPTYKLGLRPLQEISLFAGAGSLPSWRQSQQDARSKGAAEERKLRVEEEDEEEKKTRRRSIIIRNRRNLGSGRNIKNHLCSCIIGNKAVRKRWDSCRE